MVVNDASPPDSAASTTFEQSAQGQAVFRRAMMRGIAGKNKKALPGLRHAVELNPTDPTALYNLGICLYNLKLFAEAITAYRKVIELLPDFARTYRTLGDALDAAGQ